MPLEPFIPTDRPDVIQWLKAAVKRNETMDEIDRRNGASTPTEAGVSELLRTVISALIAGYATKDWNPVGEGVAMLINGEQLVRQIEQKARERGFEFFITEGE